MMLTKPEAHRIKHLIIKRDLTHAELADEIGLVSAEITRLLIPLPAKERTFNLVCEYLKIDTETLEKI